MCSVFCEKLDFCRILSVAPFYSCGLLFYLYGGDLVSNCLFWFSPCFVEMQKSMLKPNEILLTSSFVKICPFYRALHTLYLTNRI